MGTKRLSLVTNRLGTKDPWVRNDWIPPILAAGAFVSKYWSVISRHKILPFFSLKQNFISAYVRKVPFAEKSLKNKAKEKLSCPEQKQTYRIRRELPDFCVLNYCSYFRFSPVLKGGL